MTDASERTGGVAMNDQTSDMGGNPSAMSDQAGAMGGQSSAMGDPPSGMGAQPSEDEMRAAYEAELNRISSADMILQTAVSLINIGGRRLGLTAPGGAPGDSNPPGPERDLEQVRDAIDGASALLPILERRMSSRELGPLRDAVSQLQMAYAREAQSAAKSTSATPRAPAAGQTEPAEKKDVPAQEDSSAAPGPAQASGRLWVPGR
jgi:hypothetical protein